MERNVVSFGVALRKGYEPRLYTYDPDKIPLGAHGVTLDFKIWSKRIIAVNCYFTRVDTGEKFVVTAYCNNVTGKYDLGGGAVDFGSCPLERTYRVTIGLSGRGKIVLQEAVLLLVGI